MIFPVAPAGAVLTAASQENETMKRIFMLEDDRAMALQRLGVGTLLQWRQIPPGVQDAIVQQALALDWTSAPEVAEAALRDLVASTQTPSDPLGGRDNAPPPDRFSPQG